MPASGRKLCSYLVFVLVAVMDWPLSTTESRLSFLGIRAFIGVFAKMSRKWTRSLFLTILTPMKTQIKTLPLLASVLLLSSCNATTDSITKDMGALGGSILSNLPSLSGVLGSQQASNGDISAAFKQALTIGTGSVVSQLGQTGGFSLDPKIRIPLPGNLAKAQGFLQKAGASYLLDDLEKRLNLAAEVATPHAKELFVNAISQMTFDDVLQIYNGPQNSATQFFQRTTSSDLASRMQPFVNDAISQAGVVASYDKLISQYQGIPFMPDLKADLTSYVVDQGIEGIFFYLGQQEAAIRQDPTRHTTELLKKVFGNK